MADVIETFADGTIKERAFTKEERAQIELDKANAKAQAEANKAQAEAVAAAKSALLVKLGITEDEAKLLLS